jgi:hypothetical protein
LLSLHLNTIDSQGTVHPHLRLPPFGKTDQILKRLNWSIEGANDIESPVHSSEHSKHLIARKLTDIAKPQGHPLHKHLRQAGAVAKGMLGLKLQTVHTHDIRDVVVSHFKVLELSGSDRGWERVDLCADALNRVFPNLVSVTFLYVYPILSSVGAYHVVVFETLVGVAHLMLQLPNYFIRINIDN